MRSSSGWSGGQCRAKGVKLSKVWLMARVTYRRRVFSTSFVALTLGMPLIMIVASAVAFLQATSRAPQPFGLVDETGRLAPVASVMTGDTTVGVTEYSSRQAAGEALTRGEISGYMVVPAGYFQGDAAQYFGTSQPGSTETAAMRIALRQALLPSASPDLLARLANPTTVTLVGLRSGVHVGQGLPLVFWVGLPAVLGVLFALAVVTGAAQLGSAIVREKDQRAMEIVITSMSPSQLVAGKVLGMTLLSVTQLGVWMLGGVAALVIALINRADLTGLQVPWPAVFWAVALGTSGYFLYAVTASGLGIVAGDSQQAQQLAGMLGFFAFIPLAFLSVIFNAPNGPLAVGLTLFPFTAPIFGLVRMSVTEIPTWQLALSLALLVASLAAGLAIVSRVFRSAMLLYGQPFRVKQIVQVLLDR